MYPSGARYCDDAEGLSEGFLAELEAAGALALLVDHRCDRVCSPIVFCSDACSKLYALHECAVEISRVRKIAEWNERWRFKDIVTKGRATDHELKGLCRHGAGLCIAHDVVWRRRHIAPVRNVSVAASRVAAFKLIILGEAVGGRRAYYL